MTSKERAYLRSCAQTLDPVVSVGKEGLSDGVANALVQALDAHELVKVRFQSAKDEIRERSREAGLFTWNKPAYACLATRIAHGEIITPEKLRKTEEAEDFLASLGCYDFRVRMTGNKARLELRRDDFDKVIGNRAEIIDFMNRRYDGVLLDLEARDE